MKKIGTGPSLTNGQIG